MKDLRTTTDRDGFDKFLRKLATTKSGWGPTSDLLTNARWLFKVSKQAGKTWPNIENKRLKTSKTGRELKAYFLHGTEFGTNQVPFVREFLADLAIWGLANVEDEEIGAVA